ncbi:MAG TPA: ATP-binding cassette domain-containing protein [Candidatus Saccharimonadales bacterium]|nr:ATP-binding cassette domain-containing protein [Candidatus Saccharimonadales bacterium]
MEAAITATDLKKSYKKNEVLKGVTLTVARGKVFALLGSNGAGKTTTINILTTLIPADNGVATVNGFDVAKYPGKVRSSISLTGQFAAVDDILTGRENLRLIADLRHVKNSAQIATDLLKKFGLTNAADRKVHTYSGGMRRRLDIAMSLIGNPPVIFLDEPTTGLDPQARNEMWQTIKTLASSGTTIFLTTQYLDEADALADTIALLHKGTIVASGTARELKKLVPSGLVELAFHDQAQQQAAIKALKDHFNVSSNENLTLTVAVGDGTQKLAELFIQLRDAHIEPADFSQKIPTLDDVFFKIIHDKPEDK